MILQGNSCRGLVLVFCVKIHFWNRLSCEIRINVGFLIKNKALV